MFRKFLNKCSYQPIISSNPILQNYSPKKEYNCSNKTQSKGFTKLMYMITEKYNIDMIFQYILDNPDEINAKGWTALMISCRNPHIKNMGIAKFLLNNGADINLQNNMGDTALIFILYYQYYKQY